MGNLCSFTSGSAVALQMVALGLQRICGRWQWVSNSSRSTDGGNANRYLRAHQGQEVERSSDVGASCMEHGSPSGSALGGNPDRAHQREEVERSLDGCPSGSASSGNSNRDHPALEPIHKVFLSHSGAQKAFAEQLCLDIERQNRYPFFDKRRSSLPIGENFPLLIFQAIEQCQVGVVILSEDFFTRTKWPMLELVAMAKQKEQNKEFMIIPVFLGLTNMQCRDPRSHTRWISKWSDWAKKDHRIILEEWERTLKIFGSTLGISYNEGVGEVKLREEIVEAVCKLVPPETKWDDSHMQGRSRFCKLIREKMDDGQVSAVYKVHVVGLYGVGGIGKTTVCKALCNDLFRDFGGRVCLAELGSKSEEDLLREVLRRLTDTRHELLASYNKDECRDRLNKDLHKQRVFLAIDNVADSVSVIEQAKAFLRAGYKQGSIVMVTARSLGMLQCNLGLNESDCHEMPELEIEEATSLFLYNAPLNMRTHEDLIERCVERCRFRKGDGKSFHYHPLALNVLGGQLGYDADDWVERLEELDPFNQLQDIEHPIFNILRWSFDALKSQDQLLLMDVALFHLEKDHSNDTMRYWNIFEWLSMIHGRGVDDMKRRLKGLKRKSLLEDLSEGNSLIGMHDLWREFCVMETKAGDPTCQRWFYRVNEIKDGCEECSFYGGGSKHLQRIGLSFPQRVYGKFCLQVKRINLCYCSNLLVLKLVDVDVKERVLDLSSVVQLKSLEVLHNAVDTPIELQGLGLLKDLCFLILTHISSSSKCVEEIEYLTNLQVLELNSWEGDYTTRFPVLNGVTFLRAVVLHIRNLGAVSIVGLGSSMTQLRYLDLRFCEGLRTCHGLGDLITLEHLRLSHCKLQELPNLKKLTNLQIFDIFSCKFIRAVPGLGSMVALQVFNASQCESLAKLPDVRMLSNLQVLDAFKITPLKCSKWKSVVVVEIPGLEELSALRELGVHFDAVNQDRHALPKFTKLQKLSITGWSPQGLPCVNGLMSLEHLVISGCTGVDEMAGLESLSRLQNLRLWRCDFRDVSVLSNLISLQSLNFEECNKLEKIPNLDRLSRLESLEILHCGCLSEWEGAAGHGSMAYGTIGALNLGSSGTLPQLEILKIADSPISDLPDLSKFPRLKQLKLPRCNLLTRLTSSVTLPALTHVYIKYCSSLKILPDFSGSQLLRIFIVEYNGIQLSANDIEKIKLNSPGFEWVNGEEGPHFF